MIVNDSVDLIREKKKKERVLSKTRMVEEILNRNNAQWYHPSYIETKKHMDDLYGDNIKISKYTQSSEGILLFIVIACAIIPAEIFLSDYISRNEN